MNSQQQPNNLDLENEGNFRKLIRVITLSHGEFSLILLRCNYTFFQEQIFSKLQEVETVKKIHLLPNIKTIYTNIADQLTYQLDHEPPSALMVFGLESVQNIDAVLTATNQAREEFRNNFNFPVFFWVNDAVLRKIIRLAPDFKNWATTIEFKPPSHQLINFIQQETDKIFDSDITNFLFAYFCQELATAKQDLEQQGELLNPAINASLEYVFGYRDYLDDKLDSALQHYQQSLNFWQESENLDKQSKILVKIGLIYYRKASINQIDNQNSWEQARNYFEQSLEIFKRAENQDSLSQYITLLCEIYLKLQAWDKLEELVNESLKIHQQQNNYLLFLAKDYGFLAELALYKSNFQEGRNHAETALQTLENIKQANIVDIPKNEQVYYQFLLAKSYYGLGEISTSIQILETAKTNTQIEYNPQLYIDILNQLNLLYFQQEEYLTAFYTKQEKLQIEQQYGFRAFVGASYLNPQRKIIQSINLKVENPGTIAQEITASGREKYIIDLKKRITENQHKLTVIHGQSGVGKSSILQAGLIPALQQETIAAKRVSPILLRAYTNWLEELGKYLQLNKTDTIIQQLRKNGEKNLLTVLIFDQFEEFFFVHQEQVDRQKFYDFLRECLDIPDLKVVLSLREDYLHYLLEIERKFATLAATDIVNSTDIIGKSTRCYLGNFFPEDAKKVFTSLTQISKYRLEEKLIDKLVAELAGDIGEIRPIELQIVGTQLENQKITTLEQYHEIGNTETLLEGFLENVITDCGTEENKELANLVLYLLTDENKIRPLKTCPELAEDLQILEKNTDNLKNVLEILVVSGLVLLIPESPDNRYQLVHDYLVEFIRKKFKDDLLKDHAKTKAELGLARQNELLAEEKLKKEKEARQILADAKIQADKQIKKGQKRLKLSSALAGSLLVISGCAFVFTTNVVKESETKQQELAEELQKITQEIQEREDLIRQLKKAELTKKEAEKNFKSAQQNTKKSRKKLLAAKAKLEEVNKQGATAKQAQATFEKANSELKKAEITEKAALEARTGTNLELAAVNSLRQFEYDPLPSLVSAMKNGKELKKLVKDGRPLEKYPASFPIYALNKILSNIKEQNQFQGHQGRVISVSFSPNGQTIATASTDKTARLWNLKGELLQEFKHQGQVISVSFSPNGQTIATASTDKTARLWNLKGELLQEFIRHQDSVTSVSFSPNGQTIATASRDKTALLWNLKGELLQEFKGHQDSVWGVSFSPDSKTIATASYDNTARLWNLKGELLQEFKHQGQVISVSFSPNGQTIATASTNYTARLWNLQGQLLQEFKGHQGQVISVNFSPDGKTIATASYDNTARLWNLKGQLIQEFKGHQGYVNSVSFSPDGKTIATASSDNTARLWNLKGELPQEFIGHQDSVSDVSFSPNGQTIATASSNNTARLWNLQGELLQEFKGHQGYVNSVSFSPNGQTIATASSNNTARLWNLKGELLQEFKGHQGRVWSVSFSPNGQTIATASRDKTARLWNLKGGLLQEFIGHQSTVTSVSFSPDGKTIATASYDNTARLWNLKGELLQEFKGHQGTIWSMSFSPDGKTIATASRDKTALLWNLKGELLQEFKGHQSAVWGVSFSPNGQTIATASSDGKARLWNLKGELLQEFKHQDSVSDVSFSPDGKTIATASYDNTARLWPVRDLDRVIKDGCDWLKDYLQNPNVGLSEEDKRLCDSV